AFRFLMDVAHVADHDLGPPVQPLSAVPKAGFEQIALGHMRRRGPGNQRRKQDRWAITADPQSQSMLFIADEETGFARTTRAGSQCGPLRGPIAGLLFLSSVLAGRSVASMKATAVSFRGAWTKSSSSKWLLI